MDWLTGPVKPRQKGWGEGLLDEIQDLSVKQALGLPLSAPLTFGAGALSGLTFGMADLKGALHEELGDYALPDKITTSLEIAGNIGGSFVPYIGASSVASKLFTGLSLGAKMARGAFTFGGPEAIRQLVTKELDPLGAGRSLTTGALFALPRKYAAPAILGTELAMGATPEEAAIAAGFGALFAGGGKPRNTEIPTKDTGSFYEQIGARPAIEGGGPIGPMGRPQAFTRTTPGKISLPELGVAPGGKILFSQKPPSPKSQVEILKATRDFAAPAQKAQIDAFAADVKNQAFLIRPEQLSLDLTQAIKNKGPDSPEASFLRYVKAEQTGMVVPKGAAMLNPLNNVPKKLGVDLMEPGPTNKYDVKAAAEETFAHMRAQGPDGEVKAAKLAQKIDDVNAAVEAAEASGRPLSEATEKRYLDEVAEIQQSTVQTFRSPEEAAKIARRQLAETINPEQVDDFITNLPDAYQDLPGPVLSGILKDAASRRDLLNKEGAVFTLKDLYKKIHGDAGPERMELHRRASDAGAELVGAGFTYQGQKVKDFKSVGQATKWLNDLETGTIEPQNIHELRMLAHPRGIVIDYSGKDLHILNQLSQEQILGIRTIEDAARIVRNAPQVTQAAREIGPRVDAIPPMPGSGGHGGVATEQSLPFCTFGFSTGEGK